MAQHGSARTRLEQVLAQRHLTVDDMRAGYQRISGDVLPARQAYRWVAGNLRGLPYPRAQAVLEEMFGEPAQRLLGPPYGTGTGVVGAETIDQLADDVRRLTRA
ncbi:MAG: hypothetical protein M3Z25_15070 [Actinomycetota bacterium]|nr:hypothetical protein [Actinomycetota bacterium]